MERRTIAYSVIAVGVALALLALLADVLGIGESGFGWHRALLLAVGVVVAVAGVVYLVKPPGGSAVPEAEPSQDVPPGD
jgi:uncharacterized membrane protein YozB (DUF420 family)